MIGGQCVSVEARETFETTNSVTDEVLARCASMFEGDVQEVVDAAFNGAVSVDRRRGEDQSQELFAVDGDFLNSILSAGVVNILTGCGSRIGQAILDNLDFDRLVFSGSTEVGYRVVRVLADKLIPMPGLGGKSANIDFDDCQRHKAIEGARVFRVLEIYEIMPAHYAQAMNIYIALSDAKLGFLLTA